MHPAVISEPSFLKPCPYNDIVIGDGNDALSEREDGYTLYVAKPCQGVLNVHSNGYFGQWSKFCGKCFEIVN